MVEMLMHETKALGEVEIIPTHIEKCEIKPRVMHTESHAYDIGPKDTGDYCLPTPRLHMRLNAYQDTLSVTCIRKDASTSKRNNV